MDPRARLPQAGPFGADNELHGLRGSSCACARVGAPSLSLTKQKLTCKATCECACNPFWLYCKSEGF